MDHNEEVQSDPKVLNEKEDKRQSLGYLRDLVGLVAGVMLVFALLFRVVVVSGPSMNNTLYHGDLLVVLGNVLYSVPERGDVVVISKKSFDDGNPIIKRVIATEGQTVDIDFDRGVVFVDGNELTEPYCLTPTNLMEGVRFPVVVEEDCVFVMGDNRNESKDSRSPDIGMVDCREIIGKAIILLMPGNSKSTGKRDFSRIGVLS